jgi:hypothetical protein
MATADISGLFGGVLTPEEQQMQMTEARAAQFAKLDPSQQLAFMGYKAGAGLGQGLAQAAGVDIQDPAIKRATMLRQMAQGLDVTTTKGLEEYANRLQQAGFAGESAQLGQAIASRKQQEAQAALTTAKGKKELQAFEREDQLREELAKLGPDATEKDILKIVSRYGPPDKILGSLQRSMDQQAKLEFTAEEKAKQREFELQRDRQRAEDKQQLATLVASLKQQGQNTKPLSSKDVDTVNTLTASVKDASIGIDEADKFTRLIDTNEMKFGAIENMLSTVRAAASKSNPSDVAKSDLEKWVTASINAVLNQAKGVQARDDAERAKKQVMEAIDKNDPKLVRNGIQRIKKLLENTKDDAFSGLELLSEERNRDFTGRIKQKATGTKENPIVLK